VKTTVMVNFIIPAVEVLLLPSPEDSQVIFENSTMLQVQLVF
jgi:hypothetical protein